MNRFTLAHRGLLSVLVGLLSFAATARLSAQCGITFSNPMLTMPLTAGGDIVLDATSAAPAVAASGPGCTLVFDLNNDLFDDAVISYTFDCTDVGTRTVWVRAEDGNPGNESVTVELTVVVQDVTPPVFTACPMSATVGTDGALGNTTAACGFTLDGPLAEPGTPTSFNSTVDDNAMLCVSTVWEITQGATTVNSGSGTNIPTLTFFPTGTNVVTITTTDAGNNTVTCQFTVQVNDNNQPSITCPADITYNADANCEGTGDTQIELTATSVADNCADDTYLLDNAEVKIGSDPFSSPATLLGHIFEKGTTAIRYRVTDETGNSKSCAFQVVVVDNTAPVFNYPATVSGTLDATYCDSEINLTIETADVTDNCDDFNDLDLEMEVDYDDPNYTDLPRQAYNETLLLYFPFGNNTVTFYATDKKGNTGIHVVVVEILDDEKPIFSNIPVIGQNGCGSTITLNNTPGNCSSTFSWHRPNYFFPDIFECNPTADISFPQEITETISSLSVAQSVQSWLPFDSYQWNPILLPTWVNPTAQFPIGSTTITYTTEDFYNNVSTCSFKVVVNDVEKPQISICPGDQTLQTICADGKIPDYRSLAFATDNCPNSVVLSQTPLQGTTLGAALAPNPPMIGSTFSVTLTATDASGNTNATPCTFTVTLNANGDAPVPELVSQPNIIDSCGLKLVTAPKAIFPCNPNAPPVYGTTNGSVVPGSNPPVYIFNPGSYNVVWSYAYGNNQAVTQTQSITVLVDVFPPTAKCKSSISIPLQADGDTTIVPSLIDNGSFDQTTCNSPLTFEIIGKKTYTCNDLPITTQVTLKVSDNKGNSATCQTNVDVFDNTPPVFAGLPQTPVNIEACVNIPAPAAVTSSDVCSTVTQTFKADTVPMSNILACRKYNFDIIRTWTAKDTFNNTSTFVQTIRVRDTQAPSFNNAPNNQVIATGQNAQDCEESVVFNLRSFITDCVPNVDLTVTPNNGQINNIYAVGSHSITFVATDVCGNSNVRTQNFTVVDGTPPVPICNNSISTSVNLAGLVTLPASAVNNGSFDNCAIDTMVVSPNTFDCDDADGTTKHVVRLTVTDEAGNTAACETEVVVYDYVSPTITTCPSNVTIACSADQSIAALGNAAATDNCNNTLVISFVNAAPVYDLQNHHATIVRTFTATDNSGNTDTCNQIIRLTDNQAPVLSATPASVTVACPTDVPSLTVITATDNCDANVIPTFTATSTQTSNVKSCGRYNYVLTRTWTAKDVYGRTTVHTQTVTVKDTVAPVFTNFPDTVKFFSADFPARTDCKVPVSFNVDNFISDCVLDSNLVVNVAGAPFGGGGRKIDGDYNLGTYKIFFTVFDPCQNMKKDSVVFQVIDNSVPIATCFNSVSLSLGSQGTATLNVNQVNDGSNDNCGIANLALSNTIFDCGDLGTNIINLVVTDVNGNTNSCTVNVQVDAGSATVFDLTATSTATSFFGLNNGTATANPTGGSGNFTYAWSNNATTKTISNLAAGIYVVTVTDTGTNCARTASVTVADGPKLTISAATVAGAQGSMVLVPVSATQFNNMLAFQFSMHLTQGQVAQVIGVQNINPALDNPNVALDFVSNISGNDIGIIWVAPNGTPVTLAGTAKLFDIKVMLTGAVNTTSPVTFDNTPVDVDGLQNVNGSDVNIVPVFVNGEVQVNSGSTNVDVEGFIRTYPLGAVPAKAVANVEVELSGTQSAGMTTNATGKYGFTVVSGDNTVVKCAKSTPGNTDNAITTIDLTPILNSIFMQPQNVLTSPYQWVAADVNEDGKINVTDLSQIQQMALKKIQHFSKVPDWKFIPESYTFGTPPISAANPKPYPDSIEHAPVLTDFLDDHFVAVRMGDMNASTSVNLVNADDRSGGKLVFKIDEKKIAAGEQVSIPFKAKDFKGKKGYQMTIAFDPTKLEFENFEAGAMADLTDDNFNFNNAAEGFLPMSWISFDAANFANGEVLFTLKFKALSNVEKLKNVLRPGSDVILAEAYDTDGSLQSIDFEYASTSAAGDLTSEDFVLYQNQPNPFDQFTNVNFRLPETGNASIRISNAAGQLVKTFDGNFRKGLNSVRIERGELGGAGVFWLELSTSTHRAQVKMILMN